MLFSSAPRYDITTPAESSDVDSVIYLAREAFNDSTINATTVYDSYRKNPYCHLIAKDSANNIVGYTDFFLLRPATFDAFLQGRITESHFVSDDILPFGSPEAHNRIYLGGIAVFTPFGSERGRILQVLLHAFTQLMLAKYITPETPEYTAYATGYSQDGLNLLNRLGFTLMAPGEGREDNQPLYSGKLNQASLTAMANHFARAQRHYTLELRS